MMEKAKFISNPAHMLPPTLANSLADKIITSLFFPEKTTTPSHLIKRSRFDSSPFSSIGSSSNNARIVRGARVNLEELNDVQRNIDWSS